MSYTSNPINSQSLNGIISLSDGVLNIEDVVISNIQLLKVVGDSELDGNLIVDGKITCAYTALLPSDVVNKAFVDDAFNTNSRFLKVDGSNQMNADLNMGTIPHNIINVSNGINPLDAVELINAVSVVATVANDDDDDIVKKYGGKVMLS